MSLPDCVIESGVEDEVNWQFELWWLQVSRSKTGIIHEGHEGALRQDFVPLSVLRGLPYLTASSAIEGQPSTLRDR